MKRSGERKLFTWLVTGAQCTGAGFFFGFLWQLMQLMFLILFFLIKSLIYRRTWFEYLHLSGRDTCLIIHVTRT